MDYPELQVWVGGTYSPTGSPESTITLPFPDRGGGVRYGLQDSVEEETLNMTRLKDVSGAKLGYKLRFTSMEISIYEALLAAITLSFNKEFYFKYNRWPQTQSLVNVFPQLSEENMVAGIADPDTDYIVDCTLDLIEGESRI